MPIEIIPFVDSHLEPASELLAARFRRMRASEPFLPERFEQPAATLELVQTIRESASAPGIAALRDGNLAGYAFWKYGGAEPESLFSPFSPPDSVDIEQSGFCTDPNTPLVSRRLYAAAASEWIAAGRSSHFLNLPAVERDLLREWFDLGFGKLLTFTVRNTDGLDPASPSSELECRQATMDDRESVKNLVEAFWRSIATTPVQLPFLPESIRDVHRHAETYIADPDTPVWLALREQRAISQQLYLTPKSENWFLNPIFTTPESIYLFVATTAPAARGQGTNTELLARSFDWARARGFKWCTLHFLSASFANEYWTRLGFRPVYHILARYLDPRTVPTHRTTLQE